MPKMRVCSCRDVSAALQSSSPNVVLRYTCSVHNLVHPEIVHITAIEGNFYCAPAALDLLKAKEPQLTAAEFEKRVVPFEGLPGLQRYKPPTADATATGKK